MSAKHRALSLDRTLGPLVVDWIERNLCHGPGDVQGQAIELDDEQVRFIFRAYEIDAKGRRVVRRAVFSRPKGRAKSELAAMLVCAEALGPVRFAGFGEGRKPRGRPVKAPIIPLRRNRGAGVRARSQLLAVQVASAGTVRLAPVRSASQATGAFPTAVWLKARTNSEGGRMR